MTIIYLPCDVPRPLPKIVHRHHWVTPHHHHHAPAPVCDCGGGGALPGSGGSGEGFIEAPGGSSEPPWHSSETVIIEGAKMTDRTITRAEVAKANKPGPLKDYWRKFPTDDAIHQIRCYTELGPIAAAEVLAICRKVGCCARHGAHLRRLGRGEQSECYCFNCSDE